MEEKEMKEGVKMEEEKKEKKMEEKSEGANEIKAKEKETVHSNLIGFSGRCTIPISFGDTIAFRKDKAEAVLDDEYDENGGVWRTESIDFIMEAVKLWRLRVKYTQSLVRDKKLERKILKSDKKLALMWQSLVEQDLV